MHNGTAVGSLHLLEGQPHDPRTSPFFSSFIDDIYSQLGKPCITASKERIYIRADKSTVQNSRHLVMLTRTASTWTSLVRPGDISSNHHSTNRSASQGRIQRRSIRYLCKLSSNELGNSCQNIGGELRPSSKLEQEWTEHPQPVFPLRILWLLHGNQWSQWCPWWSLSSLPNIKRPWIMGGSEKSWGGSPEKSAWLWS